MAQNINLVFTCVLMKSFLGNFCAKRWLFHGVNHVTSLVHDNTYHLPAEHDKNVIGREKREKSLQCHEINKEMTTSSSGFLSWHEITLWGFAEVLVLVEHTRVCQSVQILRNWGKRNVVETTLGWSSHDITLVHSFGICLFQI